MDNEIFIEIITTHKNLLYKVCNSYCNNNQLKQDLEQEILLQLWKSFKKFDGRVKITTWIYKIALNTAISYYRKDCKRIDKPTESDSSIISLPEIEYDSETDQKITILYKVLEELPKMEKAIMLLYLDNYKYKEIGEMMGISESNVATKISRLKRVLKEQFSNY